MPVPPLEEWRGNWDKPVHRSLGMRGDAIEAGLCRFIVERPDGADDVLLRSSIQIAADIAAISAVRANLDEEREQANGTAELHVSFIAPLPDVTEVTARVIHWAAYSSHLTIEARSVPDGELVATGLTTYSLRPVARDGGERMSAPALEPRWPDSPLAEIAEYWQSTPTFSLFRFELEAVGEGTARLGVDRSAVPLRGVRDSLQGGVIAALGDAAARVCTSTMLTPEETLGVTHEVSVSYLSSARGEHTAVEARLLRRGRRIAVCDVELHDTSEGAINAKIRVSLGIEPRAQA